MSSGTQHTAQVEESRCAHIQNVHQVQCLIYDEVRSTFSALLRFFAGRTKKRFLSLKAVTIDRAPILFPYHFTSISFFRA
jgi:hypothetical protein